MGAIIPYNEGAPGISIFFSKKILRRETDLPFFIFLFKCLSILPTALAFLFFPRYSIYILPLHLFIYFVFIGRFITMYHDINHSPLFKNKVFNKFIIEITGLLYGISPGIYFSHHVMMHHPENNMPGDLNSTLPYQRDSIRDFFKYYFKFFFVAFSLSLYLKKTHNAFKLKYARFIVIAEILYLLIPLLFLLVNPVVALGVFILPGFITRSLLIIGNWGEHAFIDPKDPGNVYRSSTNIIGSYNKYYFNVGYHIGHHLKPALHFSLLEEDFNRNIEKYSTEEAVVFRDMHYPDIWFYLVTKNYKALASKFIHLPGATVRSEDDVIDLLKSRLVPIAF